mgnify:CR=1
MSACQVVKYPVADPSAPHVPACMRVCAMVLCGASWRSMLCAGAASPSGEAEHRVEGAGGGGVRERINPRQISRRISP